MAERATAFAPGRVNLIGEHTDYNEGLALPFAIGEGVTVRATATGDSEFQVVASDLDAHDTFSLETVSPVAGWRAFARGAVGELRAAGCPLVGARLEITGSVPRGSGLSSSAALEVALCLALLAVADLTPPDRLDLARLCSRVENDWVGAQTGLLDQIASLFGEPESAMCIDFHSLEVTPVALELDGYRLVTLDSGERHANAGGDDPTADGYNQRRAECVRAAELLGIASLRDATLDAVQALPEPLRSRAHHVVTENGRVQDTVAALSNGDLERVGVLLNASHASLRDRFAISTPTVERTVTTLLDAGAVGARIVGGGFGGHVLGLMPPGAVPPPGVLEVEPGPGARIVR
ncbi:MAG TPA: galactokinase family protein [Solirubrobacteraceae bacterium]|nr:galactokinase family protein [Solirubrobacteraceae bacterium]